MYPHERSLVQRLQNRPFALLGINCDGQMAGLAEKIRRSQVTWRFWVDQPANSISATWNVQGLPTLILIDADGVIRMRQEGSLPGDVLDQAIDTLLLEIEKPRPVS